MGAALIPAAIAVGGAGVSAFENEQAGKAKAGYYGYLSETAKLNSGLAESEATSQKKEIGAQENQEQIALTNRINETVGTQKASVVGGVGASSRSAQDIIGDTLNKGNLDEMALRLNADLAAKNADVGARSKILNFGNEASGDRLSGGNARAAGRMNAESSLIGGAGSVANSWYMGKMYAGRGYGGSGNIGSVT